MRRPLTSTACCLLALLVALGCKPGETAPRPPDAPAVVVEPGTTQEQPGENGRDVTDGKPTRRALLVGVTKYPNLAPNFQLEGPGNDVVLMRSVLVKEFGVPEKNIVTLSEAAGANDASLLPTRANIAREFRHLADVTRPGDEVVILLGGHGSQQPENPKAKNPEIDGLDEIFLPRDVGKWNDGVGKVENAIVDDELGEWVNAIWDRNKAFVWLVIDACHSGTMMRGGDDLERPRKTDPTALGIKPEEIAAAQQRAAARAGPDKARGEVAKPTTIGLGGKPGVFAIYAAQPTETTPERPMPIGKENAPSHGVLTYTICQTLTQARAANSPVSYRELANRVHQQYAAWGRTTPTPMVEYPSADPDREVLGPGVWKDRSNILLADGGGKYTVNAGQLVGLTAGSVLQVLPPAGVGDDPIGHVKVTNTRVTESDVVPCEFEKTPAPKMMPHGGRCKVVYVDYGDVQLRVSVAKAYPSADKELKPVPDEVREKLVGRLRELSKPDSLFRFVDDPKDAAWLLAPLPDGRVSLMPAAGWSPDKDPVQSKGYGPVPRNKDMEAWLNDAFGRIARSQGLLTLAASKTNDLFTAGELAPRIRVELVLTDTETGTKELMTLPWPASDLTVYDKDRVRLKVTNTGRVAVDVTVLYLDTDHAIDGLYPEKSGDINRVAQGQSIPIPIAINGSTTGLEHVAIIAVKGSGSSVDFLCLKQKGPERLRDVASRDGPQKELSKLLARQVYKTAEKEGARGAKRDVIDDYAMALVSWQVKGTPRPKADEPKK